MESYKKWGLYINNINNTPSILMISTWLYTIVYPHWQTVNSYYHAHTLVLLSMRFPNLNFILVVFWSCSIFVQALSHSSPYFPDSTSHSWVTSLTVTMHLHQHKVEIDSSPFLWGHFHRPSCHIKKKKGLIYMEKQQVFSLQAMVYLIYHVYLRQYLKTLNIHSQLSRVDNSVCNFLFNLFNPMRVHKTTYFIYIPMNKLTFLS